MYDASFEINTAMGRAPRSDMRPIVWGRPIFAPDGGRAIETFLREYGLLRRRVLNRIAARGPGYAFRIRDADRLRTYRVPTRTTKDPTSATGYITIYSPA